MAAHQHRQVLCPVAAQRRPSCLLAQQQVAVVRVCEAQAASGGAVSEQLVVVLAWVPSSPAIQGPVRPSLATTYAYEMPENTLAHTQHCQNVKCSAADAARQSRNTNARCTACRVLTNAYRYVCMARGRSGEVPLSPCMYVLQAARSPTPYSMSCLQRPLQAATLQCRLPARRDCSDVTGALPTLGAKCQRSGVDAR